MKIAQSAIFVVLGFLYAQPDAAATKVELDDLSLVTATPRDASIKPVIETADKEGRRPALPPPDEPKGAHRPANSPAEQ